MRARLQALGALLALVLLTTGSSVWLPTSSDGLGRDLERARPRQAGGTCVLMIDDTNAWVPEFLYPLLCQVNADSGLTGTEYELHATLICNVWGANGVDGFHGQSVPTSATEAQIRDLYGSGIIEIGMHGGSAGIMDVYASQSPFRFLTPWPHASINGGALDTSYVWNIEHGYRALADTIIGGGEFPHGTVRLKTYGMSGHRRDPLAQHMTATWFDNIRSGRIHRPGQGGTATTEFPDGGTANSDAVDKGVVLQFNRQHLDPHAYWWHGYSERWQECHSMFFPSNRLDMPHWDPPTGNSPDDIQATMDDLYGLAEANETGILTWHDQNLDPPLIGPDLNGEVGLEQVVRYMAHLACNGLFNRDTGPACQFLTMNEAMEQRSYIARSGSMVMAPNVRLEPSDLDGTKPWGYPFPVKTKWESDGWEYFTPAAAAVAGGPFGFHNQTGLWLYDAAGTDPNPLVLVYDFPPGSEGIFSIWANTNNLPETGAETDTLSAARVNLVIEALKFNGDWADTSGAWLATAIATLASGTSYMDSYLVDPTTTRFGTGVNLSGDALTNGTNAYQRTRMQGARFHTRDSNIYIRSLGTSTEQTWWKQDATPFQATADEQMRWRPATISFTQPEGYTVIRVRVLPTGLGAAADTVQLACPTLLASR